MAGIQIHGQPHMLLWFLMNIMVFQFSSGETLCKTSMRPCLTGRALYEGCNEDQEHVGMISREIQPPHFSIIYKQEAI